ncbi:uncharacterized protein G2W53_039881 [Senna tora]|uniref:Uncharacterized protein n=1 Tax=Senna tora TaxID=362788 RepID=A0A834SRS1_9FABA|nr:uncharacterized protein G2W53_039881 [Senna tora]
MESVTNRWQSETETQRRVGDGEAIERHIMAMEMRGVSWKELGRDGELIGSQKSLAEPYSKPHFSSAAEPAEPDSGSYAAEPAFW